MENTQAGVEIVDISWYVMYMSSPLMREKRHSEVTEGSRNCVCVCVGRGGGCTRTHAYVVCV